MAQEITTTSNQPLATAPPIVLCDEPGCSEPATFSYLWEWGKSGNVCSKHQAAYAQIQGNLKRRCSFGVLQAAAPPPLVRSERIQMRAEIGTLEAELIDAKARGIELYQQNTELTRQVQSLRVRNVEADAQLNDLRGKLQLMEQELVRRESQLVEARDEGLRLKALLPREPPPPDTRTSRGVRTMGAGSPTSGNWPPQPVETTGETKPEDPK